jgi:Common central domain of tyrosinase
MFSIFSRRTFTVGAAASAATLMAARIAAPSSAATATVDVNLRKDIEKLTPTELQAYEHAIKIVKDRSATDPNDPTGYAYWAGLHDSFDESIHSGCAHFSEKFFPWHRRYLFDFESLLRKTDPAITANVMIPYWDWTKKPMTGVHFPQAFEAAGSPLFDNRLSITPPPWDPDDILSMVHEPDWNIFAGKPDPSNAFGGNPGSVENGPHNTLHTNISRHMRAPATAVQDPIFWSFHAGIDLVWSRWQRLHVAPGGTQTFADPTAVIWFRDRNFTVASTAKTTDYGYQYDYDFTPDGPAAAAIAMTESVQSTSILNPVKEATQFAPLLSSNGRVTLAAPVQRTLAGNTVIRLGSIKVFSDRSYRIYLYLHPKDIDMSTLEGKMTSPYFMRLVTLWQAHHNLEVEIFVRPTPKQLDEIGKGWVITLQTESVPSDEQTSAEALGAQPNLLPTLELQER